MDDLELVRKVRALYGGDASKWIGGYTDGMRCCLGVAAERVTDHKVSRIAIVLAKALGFDSADPWIEMIHWNDAPGRTFAEVDARLAEAEQRLSAPADRRGAGE